jgi:hypothetical protein
LGYRYLVDEDDKSPYDWKREQTYLYLPIGADWKLSLASDLRLSFNTELDVLLRGKNTAHLDFSDLGVNFRKNINLRQTSGHGLRFAAKVEKDFGNVGVFVEPFYRYWSIAKSDTKLVAEDGDDSLFYFEGKNNTRELGVRIGVSF